MHRRIMRPLLRVDPFPFLAEHGQIPLEQRRVPGHGVTDCGQAQNRRRMRHQTRPCQHVTLSDGID